MEPLAFRLRPRKLDDIYGQTHLVGKHGVLKKMVTKQKLSSMILFGKPGIGETTIALAICSELDIPHLTFNASTDNKAKLKSFIDESSNHQRFVLIVDEIHRMKKDIQDYLLGFVETGEIILIGITTINPYHSVNPAVRSRCLVFKLYDLSDEDLLFALDNTLHKINPQYTIAEDAKTYLVRMSNGEVRFLINALEGMTNLGEDLHLTLDDAKNVVQKPSIAIDKGDDNYYDTLSGLQKSIRGSDVDASLHYLAKLLSSEDLLPLVRRLCVIAYEDIGLANPGIGPKVKVACDIALELGMPEARIPFSVVVCEMALSPKSNSAYLAIDAALDDIEKGNSGNLPAHLKNTFAFDPNQGTYQYPHAFPGAWVDQQYLPDKIKHATYYQPKSTSKYEEALKARYDAILKAKKKM